MTFAKPVLTALCLLVSTSALAQEPRDAAALAPASLEEFLKKQAFELLAKRRADVAAIRTPEQIAARQTRLKAFFMASLGDMPERTPLNPHVVGRIDRPGHRVEKVIFESRPGHHLTAALYLPEGPAPHPGVLVPCGHAANGKAYDSYQRMCILLARNGIAALCFDPIGQGERVQKLDEKGAPAIKEGSTTEHTMAGLGAILVGRQAASYRVWDAMRALDYLAARPEIDPKRLGCTGNSGGGTETAYLMALDDRVAVAAPSCYITSLERLFATIGPQDAEQNITGQVAAGMDHADYVLMRAPKPTLLCVGTQDFFDIRGSWDTFREVKLLYGRFGLGERVDLFESDEPHGMTKPRREAAARWFARWLLHRDEPITEPDFAVASDQELQCTRSGQVLSSLKGVSVFDLNARRAEELRPARVAFARSASSPEFRAKLRELLGLADHKPRAVPITVERTTQLHQGSRMRRLRLETEPGLTLMATDLVPDWPDRTQPVLVRLGEDDRPGDRGELQSMVLRGRRVLIAHLRGLEPEAKKGSKPSWFPDADVNASFLALHIGRPLLGQRTLDVLNLLETIRAGYPADDFPGFEVVASGPSSAVAALHAAVLDERGWIRALSLDHAVTSWEDVVKAGVSRGQLSSAVPGVLAWYDLPNLVERLDGIPVSFALVDPRGASRNPVEVRTPSRPGQ
jgi:dienelactone hydrolase